LNKQFISVIREYLKPSNVAVDQLPIRIEFENSSYINIELIKEKLLIILSTNINLTDLKENIKDLLQKCYCQRQKSYIMKLGILSTDKLCFSFSLSVDQSTLPAINEIMEQLIDIKDSLA
jgi:hypothetical protein